MTRFPLAIAVLCLLMNCTGGSGHLVLGGGQAGSGSSGRGTGGAVTTTTDTSTATSGDSNAVVVVVDQGLENIGYTNGLFASVTLCEPGTNTCQTFDHLLVDTGSVGVRVLESKVSLSLPAITATSGAGLVECTPFVDGTAWGPVKRADVRIGSETASSLPIQLIGENSYTMPSDCTGTPITDSESLGANGILGVGVYLQDCGSYCQVSGKTNAGLYYACSAKSTCSIAAVPLAEQVAHPVAAFSVDNNGVVIQLPGIPSAGAASVTGLMLFGIGTQANNGLGASTVLPLNVSGYVTTTYPANGTSYSSYLDSGSNALFFLNASTASIKQCTGVLKDFYCPSSTLSLTAKLLGTGGAIATVSFSVGNVSTFNDSYFAFDNLAGPMPGYPTDSSIPGFDWGLPFFFGRSVVTAIEDQATLAGTGPYFAF